VDSKQVRRFIIILTQTGVKYLAGEWQQLGLKQSTGRNGGEENGLLRGKSWGIMRFRRREQPKILLGK